MLSSPLLSETPTEHVEKVEFKDFEVWSIDVVMSTGEGKPKPGDAKTTIYKRASDGKTSKTKNEKSVFNILFSLLQTDTI